MSKIGLGIGVNILHTNVTDPTPMFDWDGIYSGDIVQKDGYVYKATTVSKSFSELVVRPFCLSTSKPYFFWDVIEQFTMDSYTPSTVCCNSPDKGTKVEYTYVWVSNNDGCGEYNVNAKTYTIGDNTNPCPDETVKTLTGEQDYVERIYASYEVCPIDKLFMNNRIVYRKSHTPGRTIGKHTLVDIRPVNYKLIADGINTTPARMLNNMQYIVEAKEAFNAVMFDRVIAEQIVYDIYNPDDSIVVDNVTLPIDSWIKRSDGVTNWMESPTSVLIEIPVTVPKGGKISFTLTNTGMVELGEVIVSDMDSDGATVIGVESNNKILQEDKVLPTGQLDRAKTLRPKIVRYSIQTKRDGYLRAKAIHDRFYTNFVIISPTGRKDSELTKDVLRPLVGWLKSTTYKDNGKDDHIIIPMEIRQKI